MTSFTAVLLFAVQFWGLPLWAAAGLLLVLLPAIAWMQYLAATNFYRMKHGGGVTLPADPEEHGNEPDAQRVVRYVLWLPAALDNFVLAQLVAIFYFGVLPVPWRDVGLTRLLNRIVSTMPGPRASRALALRRRWLDRYDRRGVHV